MGLRVEGVARRLAGCAEWRWKDAGGRLVVVMAGEVGGALDVGVSRVRLMTRPHNSQPVFFESHTQPSGSGCLGVAARGVVL